MHLTLTISYLLVLVLILYWINKKYLGEFKFSTTLTFFILKLFASLFFLYVYTYHYGGGELTADAGRFFQESKVLHNVFYENTEAYFSLMTNIGQDQALINEYLEATSHWNASERYLPNDSRNVIRVNSVLLFLSQGSIVVHFFIFSFLTFLGGIDVYQFLKKHSSLAPVIILGLLTIFPSIAFWGSSIIKEPLMLLGFCLLIRGVFDKLSWKSHLWRILLGTILMLMFKPYILFCFIPFIIYFVLTKYIYPKNLIKSTLVVFLVGLIAFLSTGKLDHLVHVISKQQEDFINVRDGGLYLIDDEEHYHYIYYTNRSKFEIKDGYATLLEPTGSFYMKQNDNHNRTPVKLNDVGKKWKVGHNLQRAGSGIAITPIQDDLITMVKIIPEVLLNTTIRPYPFDPGSWLKHLAFIENIVLLLLVIYGFFILPRPTTMREKRILFSMLFFALLISIIVGWTTPVLGAIVRYKVPASLGFIIVVIITSKEVPILSKIAKRIS